ncbi:AraC family transcriptional regulator [Paenibacillus allorhizosphaerae]|uniref:HTH-type transcriptional activator RhaR n=1 Tax=Paenibacillus allorhizosphaerae TaxID=2849866 RepID=A0ABN7TJM7_9BACL|nr:AraC family transcriptional regulator [Paenibacillus allorhizosphaerae]CAG7639420.1 HTH-type transcriptional activator RhaR [Paenibacillus allorhizosphaerae]
MNESHKKIVGSYLANLQMELLMAKFRKLTSTWSAEGRVDSFCRLYYIVNGEGSLKIEDREYDPKPGQMFLIPGDTRLSYANISDNTFTKFWCHFNVKVGSHQLFQLLKLPYRIEVDNPAYVIHLFSELVDAHERNERMTAPIKARAMMFGLFTYYLDKTAEQAVLRSSSSSKTQFDEILQYIEEHLAEPLTLERLGKVFNYNPNYFIRYFKSMFNMSPNHYIGMARIEKAKKLLVHTDMPLQEVASEVGLERYYFSKLFKQSTMYSPSEYRRINR